MPSAEWWYCHPKASTLTTHLASAPPSHSLSTFRSATDYQTTTCHTCRQAHVRSPICSRARDSSLCVVQPCRLYSPMIVLQHAALHMWQFLHKPTLSRHGTTCVLVNFAKFNRNKDPDPILLSTHVSLIQMLKYKK